MDINSTRNRRGGRRRGIAVFFAAMILVFILLEYMMPHFFSSFFTAFASPFWRAEFAIMSGELRSKEGVISENEELKRRLGAMSLQLESTALVEKENLELKKLLDRNTFDRPAISLSNGTTSTTASTSKNTISFTTSISNPDHLVLAPVLMRPTLAPYDEIIIDGGSDLSFNEGDKIYASERVLIGYIVEVLPHTSKVVLYSSPEQKFQVLIGSADVGANAVGRGGGQYSALLPRSVNVKVGDFVVVPSLGDRPFGIVRDVISDPAESFTTVLFAPPVNIYGLKWVLVKKQND